MKKKLLLSIAVVGVLLVASLGVLYFVQQPVYSGVGTAAKQANLAVTLPQSLPANSSVKSGPTYDSEASAVITSLSVDGQEVVISQQKRPDTDLEQIDTQDTFLVEAGSVYVLKGESGRLQAIVETPDSWIMVNADAELGTRKFKALLESFDEV